jgi:high-affinity Fe2+/Pb2+ permease
MLDWIGEKILAIVTFVPALFVEQDSPTFMAVRAMFGLLLTVLVAYLIAMRPFRSAVARCARAMSKLIVRKSRRSSHLFRCQG